MKISVYDCSAGKSWEGMNNLSQFSTEELEQEIAARRFHDKRQGEIYRGVRDPDTEDTVEDSHGPRPYSDDGSTPAGGWRVY